MPEVRSMKTIFWRTRKKFWLNWTDHHTSINEDFTLGHWPPPLLLTVPAWCFSEISLAIQASEPSHSCLVLLSNSITLWDKKYVVFDLPVGLDVLYCTQQRLSAQGHLQGQVPAPCSGSSQGQFPVASTMFFLNVLVMRYPTALRSNGPTHWSGELYSLFRNLRGCFQIVGSKDLKRIQSHIHTYIHISTHTLSDDQQ